MGKAERITKLSTVDGGGKIEEKIPAVDEGGWADSLAPKRSLVNEDDDDGDGEPTFSSFSISFFFSLFAALYPKCQTNKVQKQFCTTATQMNYGMLFR